MKVTVNKYLNARTGAPSTEATCARYRNPGDVIEIDAVVLGTVINGNAIWYRCVDDGCFYWSGGILDTDFAFSKPLDDYDEASRNGFVAALQEDKASWLRQKVPGYAGCAIGLKNDDPGQGLALVVYVDVKREDGVLPVSFNFCGITIPTDVKVVQKIAHQDYRPPNEAQLALLDNDDPLQMGGSVAVPGEKNFGSRGLLLSRNGKSYLLTCFHVLLPDKKSAGIYARNNDSRTANYPCRERVKPGISIHAAIIDEGKYEAFYDYAVIALTNVNVCNSINDSNFSKFYDETDLHTLKNKLVRLKGAASYKQEGRVRDTNGKLRIGDNKFEFQHVITAEMISTGGDSGAPVVDENNKLVGIVIAGNDADTTFILPIYKLISRQHFSICK